ncbi:MAG: lipase family protein [Bdellovibrionota bacterium]
MSTPALDELNYKKAIEFAQLSEIAYEKFELDDKSLKFKLSEIDYKLEKIFFSKETDTQAFLAIKERAGVLVFRGTEMEWLDILTDLKATLDLTHEGHAGFFAGYNSIQQSVGLALDSIDVDELYFIGHSLGGALASAAVLLESNRKITACYGFGSPPICTKERASKNKVPFFLFVNQTDVVPRVMIVGILFSPLILWAMMLIYQFKASEKLLNFFRIFDDLRGNLDKYSHFDGVYWIGVDGVMGRLKTGDEVVNLWIQVIWKNYERVFEDHKMQNYLIALRRLMS